MQARHAGRHIQIKLENENDTRKINENTIRTQE